MFSVLDRVKSPFAVQVIGEWIVNDVDCRILKQRLIAPVGFFSIEFLSKGFSLLKGSTGDRVEMSNTRFVECRCESTRNFGSSQYSPIQSS